MIRYRKHCLLQYIRCIPSTDCASPPWGKNICRQTKNECLGGVKLKELKTRTRPLQNLLRISWEILVNLGRPDSQNLLHNKSPAFYLSIYLFIYHLFIYLSFICLFVFSVFLSVCLSFFLSFFVHLFIFSLRASENTGNSTRLLGQSFSSYLYTWMLGWRNTMWQETFDQYKTCTWTGL